MRRLCERQGVALASPPGEVPRLSFDIEKIKQAVLNLVKNALEAMPEGGKIAIISAATDEYPTLTITDTGPGIASNNLPSFSAVLPAREPERASASPSPQENHRKAPGENHG